MSVPVLDLDKPEDARTFLRSIRGRKDDGTEFAVNAFQLQNGTTLTVDDMTDEQAMFYAKQMHKDLFNGMEIIENGPPKEVPSPERKVLKWKPKNQESPSPDKSTMSEPRKTEAEESKSTSPLMPSTKSKSPNECP